MRNIHAIRKRLKDSAKVILIIGIVITYFALLCTYPFEVLIVTIGLVLLVGIIWWIRWIITGKG